MEADGRQTPQGHVDPDVKLGFTLRSKGSEPGKALKPGWAR